MQSYIFTPGAGVDGLKLREHDTPEPRAHEVLVRVRATSLNYRDLPMLSGQYGPPTPRVPLSDGSGEVAAVGESVTRFKPGDRVAGAFFPRWIAGRVTTEAIAMQPSATHDGWLTEYKIFDEDGLVRIPDTLSFEEASALPCAAVTAWSALTSFRPLLAGETVLTQGSGGVSVFALQFARAMGAHIIATTSDEAKAERLRALGADVTLNYRADPDWPTAAKHASGGRGADHIIEVGGPGTLEISIRAAAVGAQINLIGVLAPRDKGMDPSILSRNIVSIYRSTVGNRADFEAMNRAIDARGIKPVIDSIFPFADARAAFRHFESRTHFGKVVIGH